MSTTITEGACHSQSADGAPSDSEIEGPQSEDVSCHSSFNESASSAAAPVPHIDKHVAKSTEPLASYMAEDSLTLPLTLIGLSLTILAVATVVW